MEQQGKPKGTLTFTIACFQIVDYAINQSLCKSERELKFVLSEEKENLLSFDYPSLGKKASRCFSSNRHHLRRQLPATDPYSEYLIKSLS